MPQVMALLRYWNRAKEKSDAEPARVETKNMTPDEMRMAAAQFNGG